MLLGRRRRRFKRIIAFAAFGIAPRWSLAIHARAISTLFRRDRSDSWPESMLPPGNAAYVLARGLSHRFGAGTLDSVAAG
jgi:hypothetical protein